jgi:glycosyltransferase involved in cell wall biosynthesis
MKSVHPTVSVVIPTRLRPELAKRAVRSALNQTFTDVEVIVVVDGPDSETVVALESIADGRMRVLPLAENVGGSEARNIGVRSARGRWIALLDDDDEWLSTKIDKQVAATKGLHGSRVVIVTQYYDRQGESMLLRPRKFPKPQQAISDFLYSETSFLGSIEGFPQTSTWFISRDFLLEVPFHKGLKRNQDTDWVLRALRLPDVKLIMVPEPLSIFYNEVNGKRISQQLDWEYSYRWALENREMFTPRAFSSFLAIMCMNHAAKKRAQWHVAISLLRDSRRYGALTPKVLWLFLLYGIFYPPLRMIMTRRLRQRLAYKMTNAGA